MLVKKDQQMWKNHRFFINQPLVGPPFLTEPTPGSIFRASGVLLGAIQARLELRQLLARVLAGLVAVDGVLVVAAKTLPRLRIAGPIYVDKQY